MKQSYYIIALIFLIAGIVLWFGLKKKGAFIPASELPSDPNCTKVLAVGSQGDAVKRLQMYLNSQPIAPLQALSPDGIFGTHTEAALMRVANVKTTTLHTLNLC